MTYSANVLCVSIVLAVVAAPATAQTARPASQNAQMAQQVQQLASERAQLQGEVSKLESELEAARKERDSLKVAQQVTIQRSRGAEADLATLQSEKARVDGDLAREKQRLEELIARFRETAESLRQVEDERDKNGQQLAERARDLQSCVEHNTRLVALTEEVLTKLEDQGFWSTLASHEPFTRLKRVQLENLADGYRAVAQDNTVAGPASQ